MDKLGDMDLFVRIIKRDGLAAAGREIGLSPARVTARLNTLEKRYGVRLINRTTRKISLTEEGRDFYKACLQILIEVEQAEHSLQSGNECIAGPLRITTMSDLGQQHIMPILSNFVRQYPDVTPYLHLSDGIVNIAEEGFDLAIRSGILPDSSMIARRLVSNRRVLCASPEYLKRKGIPKEPKDLENHDCIVGVRSSESLTTWHFKDEKGKEQSILIKPKMATNDGTMVHRWVLDGAGIALKSWLFIVNDVKENKLVTVLDNFTQDFDAKGIHAGADLHVIYPNREYLPKRTERFIQALVSYFAKEKFQ